MTVISGRPVEEAKKKKTCCSTLLHMTTRPPSQPRRSYQGDIWPLEEAKKNKTCSTLLQMAARGNKEETQKRAPRYWPQEEAMEKHRDWLNIVDHKRKQRKKNKEVPVIIITNLDISIAPCLWLNALHAPHYCIWPLEEVTLKNKQTQTCSTLLTTKGSKEWRGGSIGRA